MKKKFKAKVIKLYKDWVNFITEECDWKTTFHIDEVCAKWADICWNEIKNYEAGSNGTQTKQTRKRLQPNLPPSPKNKRSNGGGS